MGRLGRFLRLPSVERRLRTEAVVLDAGFRGLLLAAPFSGARSLAMKLGGRPGAQGERRVIVASVRAAGRAVPGSNCLSEALTGWVLLSRGGFAPGLRIGVTTSPTFRAHAWVTCDDEIVVGEGDGMGGFHPLVGDVMALPDHSGS